MANTQRSCERKTHGILHTTVDMKLRRSRNLPLIAEWLGTFHLPVDLLLRSS